MPGRTDLTVETFLILRNKFFNKNQEPKSFPLRDKRNTQDDPLDEYISELLKEYLPDDTICIKAPGPLITPDMVILRPDLVKKSDRETLKVDLTKIIAIEVKKLQRTKSGAIARASGLDYNTTPPCGTVRIYDSADTSIDIRCFYLFVCLEQDDKITGHYKFTALVLCDGNVLNQDFEYYLSITGERTKQIGLGTYKNGFDRQRPMLVFANPLGAREMDHQVTLIHSDKELHKHYKDLSLTNILRRTISKDEYKEFYCYRFKEDVTRDWKVSTLIDPFLIPKRDEKTQSRGKFRLDFKLVEG